MLLENSIVLVKYTVVTRGLVTKKFLVVWACVTEDLEQSKRELKVFGGSGRWGTAGVFNCLQQNYATEQMVYFCSH